MLRARSNSAANDTSPYSPGCLANARTAMKVSVSRHEGAELVGGSRSLVLAAAGETLSVLLDDERWSEGLSHRAGRAAANQADCSNGCGGCGGATCGDKTPREPLLAGRVADNHAVRLKLPHTGCKSSALDKQDWSRNGRPNRCASSELPNVVPLPSKTSSCRSNFPASSSKGDDKMTLGMPRGFGNEGTPSSCWSATPSKVAGLSAGDTSSKMRGFGLGRDTSLTSNFPLVGTAVGGEWSSLGNSATSVMVARGDCSCREEYLAREEFDLPRGATSSTTSTAPKPT